jgi:hypothetical protein
MKTRLLFLFILMSYSGLGAQDSTLVTIKTGSSIRDVLTTTDIFHYPQFISGKVFFRNATKSIAMMNFNRLNEQMLFIDPKGDTLALADGKIIKFIALDKDTFYYHEGYIRLVSANSVVKLAEKQIWEVADVRKIGTHNRSTNTVAVTSFQNVTDRFGKTHDLLLSEDVILRKKAFYYFADEYDHFVNATKKQLLLLFPKDETRITNYLKENKVNFEDKGDLEKLVQFLDKK